MTTTDEASLRSAPIMTPSRSRGIALRLVSGAAGALILLAGGLCTLGTALAAPLGIFAAHRIARRRGRPLSRGASWIGAAAASSIALAAVLAVVTTRMPPGTFQEMQSAAAAAQAQNSAHPPDWLARVFPQAAQRPDPLTERVVNSSAFTIYVGVTVVVMACVIWGTVAGSVGWVGTRLLASAFRRDRAA